MACWSAENAIKAYLRALKMGKRGKEPDAAEFISALAAGSNTQLMVMASSGSTENASMAVALALVAAAHQTRGRVVVILSSFKELQAYKDSLGPHARLVEFLVGDPATLLLDELSRADLVLIDCKIADQEPVFNATRKNSRGALVVGYNAQHSRSRPVADMQFLPIGEGLLVSRATTDKGCRKIGCRPRKSCWVVKVDELTGEEHVFRIVSPRAREMIRASLHQEDRCLGECR